jgi:signal transduction histidine kinase
MAGRTSKTTARRAPSPQRSLVLAFAIVTASFVAATAYLQFWVSGIHKSATGISTTVAPSIERLVALRADVSGVSLPLRSMAQEKRPWDEALIREREAALEADIHGYLAVADGRDPDSRARLESAVQAFQRAAQHVEAALVDDDLDTARILSEDELLTSAMELSAAILAAMTSAAQDATALARRIESTRSNSTRIAFVLNLLCAAAAIFAAVALSRVVRSYAKVVESRNELLAERAEELEAFAGRVAHDIVNPLGSIKLGLDLVDQRLADPALKPTIRRTLSSVDRAVLIVQDLLTFARASTPPSVEVRAPLREAASSVAEEVAEEARAAGVTLDIAALPDCAVACAPGILTSILSNLVRNAIKYTGDRETRVITLRGHERDGRVEVDIEDTGPGIASDQLASIWLPYVRGAGATARPGMGLGLATVKRLVEAHGGSVEVRSELGAGSVFSFQLPTRADHHAAGA